MGVNCMSVRAQRTGSCHCPACPRALPAPPPPTLVIPPMAMENELPTPVKDKKGSKMKVLKKIKKKMGLAPRSSCAGTPNNLPALSFHRVRGDNVRISRDGSVARRVESFCKGVAFSARPVRVNEKVCLRFAEISNNWSGVLRFGFTSHDPVSLASCLPKYACPDLTNKPGHWAKALAERFCEKDNILYYYVNSSGDVHFGINNEDKGIFFTGVDVRNSLWALVDIYGNCTAIQFADPRAPQRRSLISNILEVDRLTSSMRSLDIEEIPAPRFQSQPVTPLALHRTKGRNVRVITERGVAERIESEFCQGYVFTARPMRPGETLVVQILATESAYAGSLAIGLTSCDPGTLRPSDLPDDPEQLLDRQEYWVVRRDAANGLRRGDEMSVTLTMDGEVRVGRNGSSSSTVMHVDHTLRLWAFVDVYGATQKVRLLSTTVSQSPQVRVALGSNAALSGGGGAVLVVSLPPQQPGMVASAHYIEPMQQPQSLCLATLPQTTYQSTSCLPTTSAHCQPTTSSYQPPAPVSYQPNQPNQIAYQTSVSHPNINMTANHQNLNQNLNIQPNHPLNSNQNIMPVNQNVNINQNNLPTHGQYSSNWQDHVISASSVQNNANNQLLDLLPVSIAGTSNSSVASSQILNNANQNAASGMGNNLPISLQNSTQISSAASMSSFDHEPMRINHYLPSTSHGFPIDPPSNLTGTECTICYENPIDSVLYICGHMCMCYRCAVQQWRGKGGGQCPLCRAHIKDVIRTYKS